MKNILIKKFAIATLITSVILGAGCAKIDDFGTKLQFPSLVWCKEARAGIVRLPQQRAIQFRRMPYCLVDRQPKVRWMNNEIVFPWCNGLRAELGDGFFTRLFRIFQPRIFFQVFVADVLGPREATAGLKAPRAAIHGRDCERRMSAYDVLLGARSIRGSVELLLVVK